MKLTKNEIESLKSFNCDITNIRKPKGDILYHLLVISHGRKDLHDSGYPYIKIIGFTKDNQAINLGWHDHLICNEQVNIDSFGKNVFNIMPWDGKRKFKVCDNFISCSTFEIGRLFYKDNKDNKEFIILG